MEALANITIPAVNSAGASWGRLISRRAALKGVLVAVKKKAFLYFIGAKGTKTGFVRNVRNV